MMGRTLAAGILLTTIATASPVTAQVRAHDETWTAPETAAARANPLADRTDLAAGGRKVFSQRCAACHGDDGRGTDQAPDLAQAVVQAQADGELFWKISAGNTHAGMPAFSFLPEAQRWQLVLHVRALASHGDEPNGN